MTKLAHSYSSLKLYENCPLRYYRQRVKKDVRDMGGEAAQHGQRIHELLEKRLKEGDIHRDIEKYEPLCQAFEQLAEGKTLEVEREMTLTQKLVPTGWWDSDAWLRSKLDIFVYDGSEAVVADWKTGKRRVDFFQMRLFAAQVFRHIPEVDKVKTTLVWLKTGEMDTETYTRTNDEADILLELFKKIQRIEHSLEHDNWPAKSGPLCRWCPAQSTCDYS